MFCCRTARPFAPMRSPSNPGWLIQPHEKTSGSVEEMILTMLKPYERSDDRPLIQRRPTEEQLEQALKQFFNDATELLQTLGLPPNATNPKAPSPAPVVHPAAFGP